MSVICRRWFQGAPCIQLSSDIDGHEAGRQEILVRSIRWVGSGVYDEDWLARAWLARRKQNWTEIDLKSWPVRRI